VALAAVGRGVHVLVEKPMAPDLPAADRILAAADASGAVVQIGHVERFNPAILAAEAHLESPLFIESHRIAPFVPRSTDVAVVLDLMIHDVDLVLSLVKDSIRDIAAVGVPVLTPNVDIANARLTFTGGAVANLTASRVSVGADEEVADLSAVRLSELEPGRWDRGVFAPQAGASRPRRRG
jgi:predicted dehydrogenase